MKNAVHILANYMHQTFHIIGDYALMLKNMFNKPTNKKVFWAEFMKQCKIIGIDSIPIVFFISFSIGTVMTLQAAYMLDNPIVPRSIISMVVRNSVMLELAPSGVGAIIACVVGFKITSELGYMNIYEQSDAVKVMGIEPYSYLVAPKVYATMLTVPTLIVYSVILSMIGGWSIAQFTNALTIADFTAGLMSNFDTYMIWVAMVKIVVFSFVISTLSCYQGYFFYGSTLDLSKKCTYTVSLNCIALLVCDFIITSLML